ncbi:hypothetical protein ANCDUO_22255, partial [Ancylostoma duodenale]
CKWIRLSRALHQKRAEYEKRQHKIISLRDNSRRHVTKTVKEKLEALRRHVLTHAAYSADCAPSDYIFVSVDVPCCGRFVQRFQSSEDVDKWVKEWIESKDEEFYRRVIRLVLERWKTVIANDGQYFG